VRGFGYSFNNSRTQSEAAEERAAVAQ
jgi:hypothetical protein